VQVENFGSAKTQRAHIGNRSCYPSGVSLGCGMVRVAGGARGRPEERVQYWAGARSPSPAPGPLILLNEITGTTSIPSGAGYC
jgi:hypothetical protein